MHKKFLSGRVLMAVMLALVVSALVVPAAFAQTPIPIITDTSSELLIQGGNAVANWGFGAVVGLLAAGAAALMVIRVAKAATRGR